MKEETTKLRLNKETLRDLTEADLDRAAGGASVVNCPPRTWGCTQAPRVCQNTQGSC